MGCISITTTWFTYDIYDILQMQEDLFSSYAIVCGTKGWIVGIATNLF